MFMILVLTGCNKVDRLESSFIIMSELCKGNFAPSTEEEYLETFDKYKNTCIDETLLSTFFNIGKTVHTNVTMSDYSCKYIKYGSSLPKYVAKMRLSNGSVYTDIQVDFIVKDKRIVNVVITDGNST